MYVYVSCYVNLYICCFVHYIIYTYLFLYGGTIHIITLPVIIIIVSPIHKKISFPKKTLLIISSFSNQRNRIGRNHLHLIIKFFFGACRQARQDKNVVRCKKLRRGFEHSRAIRMGGCRWMMGIGPHGWDG